MRRLLTAAAILAATMSYATADTLDPLHGMVCSSGAAACNTDNGSFAPIATLGNFGWSFSGPAGNNTGNLAIVILAPVGDGFVAPQFSGTGILTTLVPSFVGVYTSGDLADFLGLGAANTSPANPFSGFQVGANTAVTAFNVFELTLSGLLTLNDVSSPLADIFNVSGGNIPNGVDIVAFLENTPGGNIATALSGQLQTTSVSQTPLPGAAAMLGPVLVAGGWWLRRRRRKA